MNSRPDDIEEIRRLFHEHVPEIASGLVEIRGLVRQPGNRSILAVSSKDPSVDAVSACAGYRGSRVKSIVARLNGEMIDILGWSESPESLVANVMHPWPVLRASFDEAAKQAKVILANKPIRHWSEDELESTPPSDLLALQSSLFSQLMGWRLKVEVSSDP